MSSYLILKYLHILSAVIVVGTGIGIAFFMLMASRSNHLESMAITIKHVVLADWIFTTPAVITQFVTGILLMQHLGYSYTSQWFFTVMSLFIFIGCCWLPVLLIQYRLKNLAEQTLSLNHSKTIHEPAFTHLMHWWLGLGIAAFLTILVIFWLMIFKPLNII